MRLGVPVSPSSRQRRDLPEFALRLHVPGQEGVPEAVVEDSRRRVLRVVEAPAREIDYPRDLLRGDALLELVVRSEEGLRQQDLDTAFRGTCSGKVIIPENL